MTHNLIKCGKCGDVKWHGDSLPSITLPECEKCTPTKPTKPKETITGRCPKCGAERDNESATACDVLYLCGSGKYAGQSFNGLSCLEFQLAQAKRQISSLEKALREG